MSEKRFRLEMEMTTFHLILKGDFIKVVVILT